MRGEEPGERGLFPVTMDASRQRTLETLVELALGGDMGDCYDSERAEALLRSQSSEEELSAMKVDPNLIARLWPRLDAR